MARDRANTGSAGAPPESVICIVGRGMKVVGDCHTDGTVRIEGTVHGSVQAGKAVVVGREGSVTGDIITQDAVISGSVSGTVVAESRLELQATCKIEGEVQTRRLQLEEGAVFNGSVKMSAEGVKHIQASPAGAQPADAPAARSAPAAAAGPRAVSGG